MKSSSFLLKVTVPGAYVDPCLSLEITPSVLSIPIYAVVGTRTSQLIPAWTTSDATCGSILYSYPNTNPGFTSFDLMSGTL